MTVIGNNTANNSNSLATVNLVGPKGSNASAGLSSFLDIISMLSLPGEDSNSLSKTELLTSSLGSEGEPSTVQLLQKFLDQGQGSLLNKVSTNDISEETASQFLEFLSKEVTNSGGIPNLPIEKLNSDTYTDNNVLLRLALDEIREVALPVNINLLEDGSEGQSASAISGELGGSLLIPKVPEIAQVLVNTSVMEDPEPKIVSIELGSIVESMPVGYDHAKITKLFTTSLNEANGVISRLDLVVRGDSADMDFRVDEGVPIFESVEFDGERGMENKELYIELDKPKQNTLVVNLSLENLRSTDNFPQKVNLKFSEPKLPETKLVVNFSVLPEAKFFNADELNDLTHAAVISKSGESTGNLGLGLNSKIQIFRPKFEEELISRQSLNFVSANELNESFSDKLTAKLSSITSGEFENKQMLGSLRDAISKNEAISKLDENLHISKLDV